MVQYKSLQPGFQESQAKKLEAYKATRRSAPIQPSAQGDTRFVTYPTLPVTPTSVPLPSTGKTTGAVKTPESSGGVTMSSMSFGPSVQSSTLLTPSPKIKSIAWGEGYKQRQKYKTDEEEQVKPQPVQVQKPLQEPAQMEGFDFIGYDAQGRPQYRDREAAFLEENPWFDKNMNYKKNWTPTSEEEVVSNITDPYAMQYYIGKLKGYDVKDWPMSVDDYEKKQEQLFEEQTTLLQRQVQEATDKALKQSKETQSAVQASLAQGREGVTSTSNVAATQSITEGISKETGSYTDSLNRMTTDLKRAQDSQRQSYTASRADYIMQMQAQIASAQAALEEQQYKQRQQSMDVLNVLQDSGALANLSFEEVQFLQEGMPGVPAGVVSAVSDAATRRHLTDYQQQKFETQSKALSAIKDLVGMGIQLSPEMMFNYSQQTGLPFEAIYDFNNAAQRVMQDKDMDSAIKQASLMKAGYELDDLARGITNEQIRNIEYVKDMYRRGASQAEIGLVKNMLGLKDQDDPMWRAEYEGKILTNQFQRLTNDFLPYEKQINLENLSLDNSIKQIDYFIKGINAEYLPAEKEAELNKSELDAYKLGIELQYLPEEKKAALQKTWWEMRQKQEEIKQTYGTPVYMNQAGKFQIDQTADGVRVNIENDTDGGQCGRFVNNYLGQPSYLGDSFDDKMSKTDPNISVGAPGMVFVMPYSWTGHTGVIERAFYDQQGRLMYDVVESNRNLDEKIGRRTLAADQVSGYFIPPNAVSGTVKTPQTTMEKLTSMENRLPEPYRWIGSTMQLAHGEKGIDELERVVSLIGENRGQEASNLVYKNIMKEAPKDKEVQLKNTMDSFRALEVDLEAFKTWAQSVSFNPNIATESFVDVSKRLRQLRPKEYVVYERRVGEAFAAYLKSLSGTTVSDAEATRIKGLFGDPNKTLLENQISMDQLNERALKEMDNFVQIYSNRQFKSYQDLNQALYNISTLNAKDLSVDDYGSYQYGDTYSLLSKEQGSASYILNAATGGATINYNRY